MGQSQVIVTLNMALVEVTRQNIRSLLEQCDIIYGVTPFDDVLYQECVEDAMQRGYPLEGDHTVGRFLRDGTVYAATSGLHLPRRSQIWTSFYTSCAVYVDETPDRFPSEMQNLYHFNNRFARGEPQGSAVLNTFADIIRRASEFYLPISSHLIMTATMNFFTAMMLEHETKSMKISEAADRYPVYQRTLSGIAEGYAYMAFPQEIPLNDYVQAIPEITLFIQNVNDVISFYKEENVGETTNQICTLAAQTKRSKLEVFNELTSASVGNYKTILKILEGSPEACKTFKLYSGGYIRFHTSLPHRYHMDDLDL